MALAQLYTAEEVANELGVYPRLILNLSDRHAIPHQTAGKRRFRLFTREAVEQLRPLVADWKERPRLSKRAPVPA